jgi:glycosyltransferase involved in cell wall biosynthesis
MRVGFFTYGMNEKFTGIARYAVELTRALQRLDKTLEIILLNPYPSSAHSWYQEFQTRAVPRLAKVPVAATLGNVLLHQCATALKLDILHDPCGIAPFLMPTQRYKRVTTIHDAIPLIDPKVQPLATRLIFNTLIRAARYSADAVFTVSQAAAHDLKRYAHIPEHKLFVTENGITPPLELSQAEVTKTLQSLEISQPYFLYVGNLTPRKNLTRVIEAFHLLGQGHLVIVGPTAWRGHDIFASVKDNKSITLTDYVSDQTLATLYKGSRALVFPSLHEGFGLPILEAMSYGAAVITSHRGALAEVAADAALLVDPTSVTAIHTAMQRMLKDDALHSKFQGLGLERVKHFSWQNTATKTLEVYKRLIEG